MNDNPQRLWNGKWVVLKKVAFEVFKGQLSVVRICKSLALRARDRKFFFISTTESKGQVVQRDRDICLLEQERNPTDVVLVGSCNQNSL